MRKSEELNEKELDEYFQKKQYEIKATDSLIWLLYAQDVYRSSEILANRSIEANKKAVEKFYERAKSNQEISRVLTDEEYLEHIDENQIRIAYFLLSRAIELVLKGILIEMNPNRFYKEKEYEMKFGKSGHDILSMMKETGILLDSKYQSYLNTLNEYIFSATYPVLKKLPNNNITINEKIDVTHHNYRDVTKLYDILFEKLNELRVVNNKGERRNILKIE